jgi:hypothetical protein
MLALQLATLDIGNWTTWAALGTGVVVTSLVLSGGVMYGRRRRRRRQFDAWFEEDMPWDVIKDMLEKHNRALDSAGMPPEDVTEELLGQLIKSLPAVPNARPLDTPEDYDFQLAGGVDRRSNHRRWGNPTEVNLRSVMWDGNQHGLIVNRSTGGLGIYTDKKVPLTTAVRVGAVDAPAYVPWAMAEVRHCRKVGKGFFLGCQFNDEIPWHVRVWFG